MRTSLLQLIIGSAFKPFAFTLPVIFFWEYPLRHYPFWFLYWNYYNFDVQITILDYQSQIIKTHFNILGSE